MSSMGNFLMKKSNRKEIVIADVNWLVCPKELRQHGYIYNNIECKFLHYFYPSNLEVYFMSAPSWLACNISSDI